MSRSPGLLRTILRQWADIYQYGTVATVSIFILSWISVPIIWLLHSEAIGYLLVAILVTGLHLGTMYAKDMDSNSYNPNDIESYGLLKGAVITLALAGYFTPLMVVTAVGASFFQHHVSIWAVPLLFAMYAPLADFKLVDRYKWSPGSIPVTILLWGVYLALKRNEKEELSVDRRGNVGVANHVQNNSSTKRSDVFENIVGLDVDRDEKAAESTDVKWQEFREVVRNLLKDWLYLSPLTPPYKSQLPN